MDLAIPSEEFAERRRKAVAAARERGLDGLLVWSRNATAVDHYGDVLYLTNHYTPFPNIPDNPPTWSAHGYSALVLPVDGEPVLVSDDYRDDLVRVDDVRIDLRLPDAVGSALRELGLHERRVGLVGRDSLLHASYLELERACGRRLELEPADDILARLRLVKSEAEVRLMRHAAEVGNEWMRRTMAAFAPGKTEGECVGEGLAYAAAHEAFPYDVAVASGPHADRFQWARLPSWDSERRLEPGDLVHVDLWGPVKGYYTDMVRSTVIGRSPSEAQRELLEGSVAQIEHIVAGVRPGVRFGDLYRRGADWYLEHGFAAHGSEDAGAQLGELFPAFGHSLGLGVESPWITADEETPLEPSMVLAIETQVGRPGLGAAGFEHDVLVTADGCEVLTAACPARWWD